MSTKRTTRQNPSTTDNILKEQIAHIRKNFGDVSCEECLIRIKAMNDYHCDLLKDLYKAQKQQKIHYAYLDLWETPSRTKWDEDRHYVQLLRNFVKLIELIPSYAKLRMLGH
jgi:hypothetical protein